MALASTSSWKFVEPPPIERIFPAAERARARLTSKDLAILPRRTLRLAEFLFHCGRITWQQCCDAVRWQREQRASVGQIAVELGFLTPAQVAMVLRERVQEKAYRQPFCEYAVEKGYLLPAKSAAVLAIQRRRQRRIGDFFVERGLLTRDEVDDLARELRSHNARQPQAR